LSLFVTFEGPEGSGKTTQMPLLEEYLKGRGYSVLCAREPGGTPIGEQIRAIILSRDNRSMGDEAEVLLFSAARAQIVAQVIRPALASGAIVLCDRYADSTLAYQGYGLGLDLDALRTITHFATGGLVPDLTFYIDVPVELGLARRRRGEMNRLDEKEVAYHARVREGYLKMARAEPRRWIVVDGSQSPGHVQRELRAGMNQELTRRGLQAPDRTAPSG
jgi:dTMP kinase